MVLSAGLAIGMGAWVAYYTTPMPLAPQLPDLGDLDRWYARSVGTQVVNRTKDEVQVWAEAEGASQSPQAPQSPQSAPANSP